jgi:hypothetical protein
MILLYGFGVFGLRQQGRVIRSLPGASLTLFGPTEAEMACGSKEESLDPCQELR